MFKNTREIAEFSAGLMTGPNVALSGGSTYGEMFSFWSGKSDLSRNRYFPVDERVVPFEDENSNWKMATNLLFNPLGIPDQKQNWARSRESYEKLLLEKAGDPPIFDQVFLGMGDDGHTASLFPGGEELRDTESLVLDTLSPKTPVKRITLGLKILWSCRDLILIVTGRKKSGLLKRLFNDDRTIPAGLALAGHKNPLILADEEAGKDL